MSRTGDQPTASTSAASSAGPGAGLAARGDYVTLKPHLSPIPGRYERSWERGRASSTTPRA
jgi:hypothetical protein